MKIFTILLKFQIIGILLILCSWSISEELYLKATQDRVTVGNGSLKLKTQPQKMSFTISSPFGNFNTGGRSFSHIKLDSIHVLKDSEEEKEIILKSKPIRQENSEWEYSVLLTAKKNFPGIKIKIAVKNLGNFPNDLYFFFKLVPIKSDLYYDEGGEQKAAKTNIKFDKWLFLPSDNTIGGYGLIISQAGHLRFQTNYPNSKWRKAGWYFIMNPNKGSRRIFKKGESNELTFQIFPAETPIQVEEIYQIDHL